MKLSKLKNKKIGIIGLGYIGKNFFNYLNKLNLDIKLIPIKKSNIYLLKEIEFDYLINCAGTSGNFRSKIIETIDSNLNLNSYILTVSKIKHNYIFLSSTRIYGFSYNEDIIFYEDSITSYNHLNIDYIYNGSKKLTECLLLNYKDKINYNILILRISNVYGNFNKLDDSTLLKKIFRYKLIKKKLIIKYNRYSKKDYIHINDVIKNICNAMIVNNTTDVYNLASGKSYSLDDIAKFLDITIETDETIRPIYSNISNKKFKDKFGLKLDYDFEQELKRFKGS